MKAMLVIKTKNGYAVAPYTHPIPNNFAERMDVAPSLVKSGHSYSVMAAMVEYFSDIRNQETSKKEEA